MTEATEKKQLARSAAELLLAALGGWFAISSLLAIAGNEPHEGVLTNPVVALMGWMGAWPCLLFTLGLAVAGAWSFLASKPIALAAHAFGVLGVGMALSLICGAFSATAGGALGATLGSVLPGMAGLALGLGLGLAVLLATVWLAWLPQGAGFYVKPRELSPVRAVGKQEDADGVSAAEAEALQADLHRGTRPDVLATAGQSPLDDVRNRGGVPEGAQALDAPNLHEPTHSEGPREAGAPAGGIAAATPPADEPAGADLAPAGAEVRAEARADQREPGPAEDPADAEPLAAAARALASEVEADPGVAVQEPDVHSLDAPGVEDLPIRPSWEDASVPEPAPEPLPLVAEEPEREEPSPEPEAEVEAPELHAGGAEAEVDDEEEVLASGLEEEEEYDEEDEDLVAEGEDEEDYEEYEEEEDEEDELAAEHEEEELDDEEDEELTDDDEEDYEEYGEEDEDVLAEHEEEEELEEEEVAPRAETEEEEPAEEVEEPASAAAAGGWEQSGLFDEAESQAEPEPEPEPELVNEEPEPDPEPQPEEEPEYVLTPEASQEEPVAGVDDEFERVVLEAGSMIVEENRVAVSMLQRRFDLDFKASTRVLDELQARGLIGPYLGGRSRDILMSREEWMAAAPRA